MGIKVSFSGNLVKDPELRYTQSGVAVAKLVVASSRRARNPQTGNYEDVDTTFMNVTAWRQLAENVAETLRKGMRVVVNGRLIQRQYETEDGSRRRVFEVVDPEIAVDLTFQKADVERASAQPATQAPVAAAPAVASPPPVAAPEAQAATPAGSIPTPGSGSALDGQFF